MPKHATDYTYFNLHSHEFSVRYRGLVRAHSDWLLIIPGRGRERVGFRVSEAGRQRVLEEQRKNVHAFVVGDAFRRAGDALVCETRGFNGRFEDGPNVIAALDEEYGNPKAVSYNPYRGPTFYHKYTDSPITGAAAIIAVSGHGNYPPLLLAYDPR